jgi:DNA-binding SARP family transcriptional activator
MLDIKMLGQFDVLQDGTRLNIPTRHAQALFAYLILNAGIVQRRERLAGLLWPDSSDDSARGNLRHELWRLRKACGVKGEVYLLVDDLSITFNAKASYCVDVQRFESALCPESGKVDLIKALSVYRGELLPGFYDEWVFVERQRLSLVFENAMARLLDILQSEQRWGEILDWAMRWISVSPLSEAGYRAVMIAYASTGDLVKAAETFEHFNQRVQKELGIKPSEQTLAIYRRVKAGWRLEV